VRPIDEMKLITIAALALAAAQTFAQIGGGAATYNNQQQSAGQIARAAELAKRNYGSTDAGRYIDASVLMNIEADEYVAVFAINHEGKTLEEARQKMDTAAGSFTKSLAALKVLPKDIYVDFVAQNRIYGYENPTAEIAKEVVVGFEVKKNVAIHYRDKSMLDAFAAAASKAGIFDLVKVDYVVKDIAAIHKKLLEEAARIIKRKQDEQELLLGVKIGQIQQAYPAQYSTYFPVELYNSYVAQESEEFYGWRNNQNVQRARKPKTFYFDGLSGKDFDVVINPVLTEPAVQCTVYVRVKY
jgi:uncharacterized protein YggE